MNESQMKMIIPPTVGILVAGIASGICYLLIGSLRKGKGEQSIDDRRCACCLKPFGVGRGVECNDCGARSCRKACCRWDSLENSWFCLFCYHSRTWARRREKWFRSFGGLPLESENNKKFSTAKSRVYDEGAEHVAIHSELVLAAGGRKEGNSMETVREFVEKIVEGLVGNVDDTPIDRIYHHSAYKPATDTPTMAHTALRELVERAVGEARKLPCLGATVSTGLHDDSNFSEQNYEDLLATAILNKVIEKFQNERVDDNSNVLRKRSRSKYANRNNEIGLDEGVDEGSSSLEPLSQDECSSEGSESRLRHTRIRQEPMSLTIEEQIEEVTTTYTSDEEIGCNKANVLDFRNARRVPFPEFGIDIVDPSQDSSEESQDELNDLHHVDIITPVETWEENWLFQRRKIKTQSEPVSMLVPNPSADFRALIGDKDADDTSDLSEFSAAESDDDDIDDNDNDNDDDDVNDVNEKLFEAINKSIRKSSKIDKNFSMREKIHHHENEKIYNSPKKNIKIINKNNQAINDNEKQLKFNSNENFDNVFSHNHVNEVKCFDEMNLILERGENRDSGLSENSYEPERKYATKNSIIQKIPETSTIINSSLENKLEINSDCDFPIFDEKFIFIDEIIDDKKIQHSYLRDEEVSTSHLEKSRDKIDKEKLLSSSDVNENFKSSKNNESLENISHDKIDIESIDQCNGVVQRILENSLNEEIQSNGNGKKIEDLETNSNGNSIEGLNSHCETLKLVEATTESEKKILRNFATESEIELSTPPRPGTIAEREHKKWENAAPIENNPYTEENIQKRLLERQYARRSSDVSGSSNKLQTSPSQPLQIIMGAGRPDFKRFGRDYYINEAKCSNGRNSVNEPEFFASTSRPNSSMSQNSLTAGSDNEHQEHLKSIETESICSNTSESRIKKIRDSRRNNVTADLDGKSPMPIDPEYETRKISSREMKKNDEIEKSMNYVTGKKNSYNEIIENERKNNKNEINARLNNHGNFDENLKSIKRIDLRSYGFSNEFNVKNNENLLKIKKSKRIIDKLDIRSFGYDSGLRRTQSNNNIDSKLKINISLKSRKKGKNFVENTNLIDGNERQFFANRRNEIMTKSTECLNDEEGEIFFQKFEKIKSAKSVPNIGQLFTRCDEKNYKCENNETIIGEKIHNEKLIFLDDKKIDKSENLINHEKNSDINGGGKIQCEEKSMMPSVKKLAQAFNKTEKIVPPAARKSSKILDFASRDRPTTPEIHIVDTPRQMHSLTARSISREFREGLRQISSKQTTKFKVKKLIPEKNHQLAEFSTTTTTKKSSESSENENFIAPGKLKNNIQFWEKINKKS